MNMRKIIEFLKSLFSKKEIQVKEGYYLYVRVYFKHGRIADFLAYPINVAESGLGVGQIKKIKPLTEKQKHEVIRKELKLKNESNIS